MRKKKYMYIMNEYCLLAHVVQLKYDYWDIEIDLFLLMRVYEKLHADVDYYVYLYSEK